MSGETVALVVGNGGREHALAEELARTCTRVVVGPGNAGLHNPDANIYADPGLNEDNIPGVADFALRHNALVVIGPEKPLVKGAVDYLKDKGVIVFGPSAEAAQLEAGKSFAIERMREEGVDHPRSYLHPTATEARKTAEKTDPNSYVIKEDGLAGGKGVYLPRSHAQATKVIEQLLKNGTEFLFQERLKLIDEDGGRLEFSAFAVCDGRDFLLLPFAQDHKALNDNDEGPNTGGMGAYAPIPLQTRELANQVADGIVDPILYNMRRRGTPFSGLLYVGGVVVQKLHYGPAVIEFNARFGDPETQVVLPQLKAHDIDGHELLRSAATGKLNRTGILEPKRDVAAVTVALTTPGYPRKPVSGQNVHGHDGQYPGVKTYWAGVKQQENGDLVTDGGRVGYPTAVAESLPGARKLVYAAIGKPDGIWFEDAHHRTDIAQGIA